MSFFSTLGDMSPVEAAEACKAEIARLHDETMRLQNERSATPRGDKQKAAALLVDFNRAAAELKRVREVQKVYKVKAEQQEEHGLWALAVRVHAGDEVLLKCFAWMKAERKRRLSGSGAIQDAEVIEEAALDA